MNLIRWMMIVLCVVTMTHGAAADDPATFRFTRPIETEAAGEDEVYAAPLDSDTYAATRDGFPDLRVLDGEGQLVPFLIRRSAETRIDKVRKVWAASKPRLQPLDNNGMEIRFSLDPTDPIPLGMRFVTPLKDFEQQVRIFGIENGTEATLVDASLIMDYSQFMDFRRTEILLPATTAREYRIVIDALTADQESQLLELTRSMKSDAEVNRTETTTIQRRPFRIDRIELWSEEAEQSRLAEIEQQWPVSDFVVTQETSDQQTVAEFRTQREPLTALTVKTTSRNFSRHVTIQTGIGSGEDTRWQTIAESTISQFQLRELQDSRLSISIPETRHERYRILIDNHDGPELMIDGITAFGHRHEIVFLKSPEKRCRLVYGSDTAVAPSLDTVALQTGLSNNIRPIAASLGPATQRPVLTVAPPTDWKTLFNNPFVLGTIIGVLVLALGWGLFQASRRIEQMPHKDVD